MWKGHQVKAYVIGRKCFVLNQDAILGWCWPVKWNLEKFKKVLTSFMSQLKQKFILNKRAF